MVEVIKEVVKEVPGPERIVEVVKEVIVPQRVINADKESVQKIIKLAKENDSLKKQIKQLESAKPVETVVEVEKIVEKIVEVEKEVPVEVERVASGDLREAARLMANSEFNKEDLSEDAIFDILQKSSADEVKRKLGFWAVPLPKQDISNSNTRQYIGKK